MQTYANLGGNSDVRAYEIFDDGIRVRFGDGSVYVYTDASAGAYNIECMKACAERGYGLNGYINRNCRFGYAYKE